MNAFQVLKFIISKVFSTMSSVAIFNDFTLLDFSLGLFVTCMCIKLFIKFFD